MESLISSFFFFFLLLLLFLFFLFFLLLFVVVVVVPIYFKLPCWLGLGLWTKIEASSASGRRAFYTVLYRFNRTADEY